MLRKFNNFITQDDYPPKIRHKNVKKGKQRPKKPYLSLLTPFKNSIGSKTQLLNTPFAESQKTGLKNTHFLIDFCQHQRIWFKKRQKKEESLPRFLEWVYFN